MSPSSFSHNQTHLLFTPCSQCFPFSLSSRTCQVGSIGSSICTLQPRPILFLSSLYFPSQPQSVYPPLTLLTNLSGRPQTNQQGHLGGRATSGGGRDPSSPLSFPYFEFPKYPPLLNPITLPSPCHSPTLSPLPLVIPLV